MGAWIAFETLRTAQLPGAYVDTEHGSSIGRRTRPRLSVAIVGICGAEEIDDCLTAMAAQQDIEPFEVVVAYDPRLKGVAALADRHPAVRWHANEGQESPLELAAVAIAATTGEIVALTEDHCLPDPRWLANLVAEVGPGRGAVGGTIGVETVATSVEWAFYFVDFFRYAPPVTPGPSPSLTVCNVAYRREDLDAIGHVWADFFHETAVNQALADRFGALWLSAAPRVRMLRQVRFMAAIRERFAFGRLFGATRIQFMPGWKRWLYAAFSPGLPVLLMGRMIRRGIRPPLRARFLGAALPILAMVIAWTAGEWLGYFTAERPRDLSAASPDRSSPRASRLATVAGTIAPFLDA